MGSSLSAHTTRRARASGLVAAVDTRLEQEPAPCALAGYPAQNGPGDACQTVEFVIVDDPFGAAASFASGDFVEIELLKIMMLR